MRIRLRARIRDDLQSTRVCQEVLAQAVLDAVVPTTLTCSSVRLAISNGGYMTVIAGLLDAARQRREAARETSGTIGAQWPVRAFLDASLRVGARDHYKHLPAACHDLLGTLIRSEGPQAGQLLLELALWQGLVDTIESGRLQSLPGRVQGHQIVQIQRLLQIDDMQGDWLAIESDMFQKEFGLATLRLYAAASQLVDPRCGVPRSIIFKAGLRGLSQGLRMVLACGGFAPFFQIHTHTAYLDEFNEEGWNECYRVCADLYSIHPKVLGMFGGSWFYDPKIREISPRLAYLSEVPTLGGARVLLAESDGEFVQDALATSPTRRKLHEEGKYKPQSYMLVWDRRTQVQWATDHA